MKKTKKMICILCLICLLLPLLCGCKKLDEMRTKQAFYDENGNILWNGAVYKQLPQGEYFQPNTNYENRVYVTEPDVPVLLHDLFFKQWMIADDEGLILDNRGDVDLWHWYYCREDRYEELAKRLQEPFQGDMLYYSYWFFDENGEYGEQLYRLTDEEWGVLRQVLETAEPLEMDAGWKLAYDATVTLVESSEDRLFSREFLELMVCGDTYYLRLKLDPRESVTYQVPEEAAPFMAQIMEAEIKKHFRLRAIEMGL